MDDKKYSFSNPNPIEPGTQVDRMGILYDLADHIGVELNVPIQPINTVAAADPDTKPAFMYEFGPTVEEISLVAHGHLIGKRDIDTGNSTIDHVDVGNQIRQAIKSLQAEHDKSRVSF